MEQLFSRMVETLSVTGNEEALAALIEQEVMDFADEISRDVMGNLIVLKRGEGKIPKKIMFSAHMDEIGYMITYIDDKGYLHFSPVGGLRLLHIAGSPVLFKNGVRGVVMYETKVATNDLTAEHFYIDIGAASKEEAEGMVSVGDVAGTYGTLAKLGEHRWASKSMDDKIACFILIRALQKLKSSKYDAYFVFSTQEEVGLRGATTAAYRIDPDYGIALDVTGVGDMPNQASPNALELGKGAAIKVRDSSVISSRRMVNFLVDVAKRENIPYQMEVLMVGGTDAGAIQRTREGVVVGGISIPTRYIHSAVETVDYRDIEACIDLVAALLQHEIE